MIKKIVLFIIINFTALGVGSIFTKSGVSSEWYTMLNKAPWTPPGYMFGIAWSTIMVLFAVYVSYLLKYQKSKEIIGLFVLQWILNVSWNPVFFYFQNTHLGLVIILSLLVVITTFLFRYVQILKAKSLLILPYFIWLMIACSLNLYIVLNN
ncbi:TspO/MBR family protein [Wenyingzhuangia sp. IMCC45533]